MSFRAGLFLGSCAALVATVPAAYRVAQSGGAWAAAWLLLAGGSALLLGPIVGLCRAAPPANDALQAVLFATALCALPLARWAALLEHNTHHRPLGAVTFAIGSALLLIVASFVAWRALVWLKRSEVGARRERPRWMLISILGVTLVGLGVLFTRAAGAEAWRASLLDGVLALLLALGCILVPLPPGLALRLSRLGLPMWATVVVIAVWLSRGSVGALVGETAPLLSPLNGW